MVYETGEISNQSQIFHNLNLQREQTRYLKQKYLKKLEGVKIEKKNFGEVLAIFLIKSENN